MVQQLLLKFFDPDRLYLSTPWANRHLLFPILTFFHFCKPKPKMKNEPYEKVA